MTHAETMPNFAFGSCNNGIKIRGGLTIAVNEGTIVIVIATMAERDCSGTCE